MTGLASSLLLLRACMSALPIDSAVTLDPFSIFCLSTLLLLLLLALSLMMMLMIAALHVVINLEGDDDFYALIRDE